MYKSGFAFTVNVAVGRIESEEVRGIGVLMVLAVSLTAVSGVWFRKFLQVPAKGDVTFSYSGRQICLR